MEYFWLCLAFVALPFVAWGVVALVRAYVLPPKSVPARLKKKEIVGQETAAGGQVKKYRLTFEIDEKKRRYFVSAEDYRLARPSTDGILTTRGHRFLSFERRG